MIQLLASTYQKQIAGLLLLVFYSSMLPVFGKASSNSIPFHSFSNMRSIDPGIAVPREKIKSEKPEYKIKPVVKQLMGGPTQPEMSSFKSIGSDNLVNLFTGDFNYNIPLLDVGGYPINIFYNGGITMEQEASWVGLGWNINPGAINRNMRGVPDDFNGEDLLLQKQKMKPNITWGANLAADFEFGGRKDASKVGVSLGGSMGLSFNNYLGPAMDIGLKGGVNFSVASKVMGEKSSLGVAAGLGANISSRNGLTLSPNVSLTSKSFANVRNLNVGVGLSTSYNSRSGIKQMQLYEQMSYNYQKVEDNIETKDNEQTSLTMGSIGASLRSATISFAKPSYIPSLRLPISNEAYAGHFQLGGGMWGIYVSGEAEVYQQKSQIANEDTLQVKPLYGYLYYQKAANNPNAVMDFTRFNDNEVTANTPIISAPQYSYDVFSIQGEGTGGTIRAYRNDLGYVRDNTTKTKDKSLSIGGDVGIPGHYGGNFNIIVTPSVISEWKSGNKLKTAIGFTDAKDTVENVYFRNPGETSVLNTDQYNRIGGTDLVRFKLGGTNVNPSIEPILEQFSKSSQIIGTTNMASVKVSADRKKRTQVTSFLTAEEAALVGLDKTIKSYVVGTVLDGANNLLYDNITRVSEYRKKHHLSQISVTEASGKRYVYGIPVYNIVQKDFSFSVDNTETADDKVNFVANDTLQVKTAGGKEGFIQITETPAYAHSFLLTGLLSPDYVDITGNGITEDDLGGAVKFNYTRVKQGAQYLNHAWRTPHTSGATPIANFNAGNRTETKDDKGLVTYGNRESWYVHSIESKTMIALFTLEDRDDGNGPVNELSGVNTTDNSLKRLKKIDLYNKADLKKNGIVAAKPIKTVWFSYSYSLCQGTPDNPTGGKLTLDSIYFTFNGKDRVNKNKYAFSYGGTNTNPAYTFNASDRWGNYKPKTLNPGTPVLKNADYPYAIQDKTKKAAIDSAAASWDLKKILLPSGAQLEVEYESDDYAYVQNRRATDMMEILGFSNSSSGTYSGNLYTINGDAIIENDYVYIKVPEPCTSKADVLVKYLAGIQQLAFKTSVNMVKGPEFVMSYATIADYNFLNSTTIWIKLNLVDGLSPVSLSALEFLRQQLPGQAFPAYEVNEGTGLQKIGTMLSGMWGALQGGFKDPVKYLRTKGKAQTINLGKSFVRLNDPDGYKYGGGNRVKSVKLKDNWKIMSGQDSSHYGQLYDYTTTETFNGTNRTISSGVASYEPSVGGEENPFQTIVQVSNKLPLGPTSYGAIEMPVLDAFFPAPSVGYSKVTVRSIRKIPTDITKKSRSGIGSQVTEFYTAKDFPVYYSHTALDPASDKQEHKSSTTQFQFKFAYDGRALSQGFLVQTNDMHGRMKSQSSYADNDSATRISYTENFYRNTGANGLNEKFDFLHPAKSGAVIAGNMGIDVELMTDTREFSVKSTSLEVQGQLDWFVFGLVSFWLPFVWNVTGVSETVYRAVTTTKVVDYHSVLDSIIVIDKGSKVSTKNLVYDAETGEVLIKRTNNEFEQPIYTVNYPAYWAYSGMGLAYKNTDAVFSNVNFLDGKITSGNVPIRALESGDEILLINPGTIPVNCNKPSVGMNTRQIWLVDKVKNANGLTNPTPDYIAMDSSGALLSRSGVTFRIIRSGKRNLLGSDVASVMTMTDPVIVTGQNRKLTINNTQRIVNSAANDFREKWQVDNEVILKKSLSYNATTCVTTEIVDCNGYLEKSINPYRKGLMGNYSAKRSYLFYGNRLEKDPLLAKNIPVNGFLENFKLYWDFNASNNLVPDLVNANWVWNSELNKINAHGLELETRDALNIYTAAQYGYNGYLPEAITNNARYNETGFDGFEDNAYNESINNSPLNICTTNDFDFRGLTNASILTTDNQAFNAHTGKYVLAVNQNATASKSFNIKSAVADDFSFNYGLKDTVKSLYQTGQTMLSKSAVPVNSIPNNTDFVLVSSTNTLLNLSFTPLDSTTASGKYHRIQAVYKFYMDVPTSGTYPFNFNYLGTDHTEMATAALSFVNLSSGSSNGFSINAYNCFYTYPSINCGGGSDVTLTNVFLCKGTYELQLSFLSTFSCLNSNPAPYNCTQVSHALNLSLTTPFTRYKNLTTQSGCISSLPLPATDSMINPGFTIQPVKKMVFSGWVREDCNTPVAGVSCADSSYLNNKVIISYNDGTNSSDTIRPTGAIIEGWQRYEGYFTPRAGATQFTVNLVNTNNRTIYFDDIRIHPFNANMKSFVYDPVNLRLAAELDANNYARFYEYDEEGTLVRTKAETAEGIKTINETRSFQQRQIKQIQQ